MLSLNDNTLTIKFFNELSSIDAVITELSSGVAKVAIPELIKYTSIYDDEKHQDILNEIYQEMKE